MMTRNFIKNMPKVELHVHLEGSIPLPTLWELMKKYGRNKDIKNILELERKFTYSNFPHFIETWIWKNQFLQEYEDFEFFAEAVAADFAAQNIRYAEVFFSAPDFAKYGLKTQELACAIRKGLDKQRSNIEIKLIADLVRDFGPDKAVWTLNEVAEVMEQGIIGIGIGGSEQDFPPEPFAPVYEKARNFGFKTTAHAGEVAGAKSIWGAIEALRVDRIGHGTRAIEDGELVDYLIDHQIPVEMCPISNLRTGAVDKLEHHPIKQFLDFGMLVSVNSDDPKMFNTSLEEEYLSLMGIFELTKDEVKQLAKNAIASAWCDKSKKLDLMNELEEYFTK